MHLEKFVSMLRNSFKNFLCFKIKRTAKNIVFLTELKKHGFVIKFVLLSKFILVFPRKAKKICVVPSKLSNKNRRWYVRANSCWQLIGVTFFFFQPCPKGPIKKKFIESQGGELFIIF